MIWVFSMTSGVKVRGEGVAETWTSCRLGLGRLAFLAGFLIRLVMTAMVVIGVKWDGWSGMDGSLYTLTER